MRKGLFLCFYSLCTLLSAQYLNPVKEWGKVSVTEMSMETYVEDPEAEALVLFDLGDSFFFDVDRGFEIRFTRIKRIKILKDTGVGFGEFSIPIYKDGMNAEKIASIEAISYNLEQGTTVKTAMIRSDLFEERISENWYLKKFAVPNVKRGTVIEIKYTLESPFLFNLPDWEFQDRIPTLYSEYTVHMVPFYEYVFLAQGITTFDVNQTKLDPFDRTFASIPYNDQIYTFGMKNIPAFRDESFITSRRDYITKIDFQLSKVNRTNGAKEEIMTNWPTVIEDLTKYESFGKYIKKSASLAEDFLIQIPEKSNKAIIEYVKSYFTWNGDYSGTAFQNPKELMAKKTGNSADINLFLSALLESAGFDATPVLISTRTHGKIKSDYPFLHFFNNVLVLVNDPSGKFITDGTSELISYNRIPPNCINEKGLVVKVGENEEITWLNLSNSLPSSISNNLVFELTDSPQAKLSLNTTAIEYKAYELREEIAGDSLNVIEYFKKKGVSAIDQVRQLNATQYNKPYTIHANGSVELEQYENQLVVYPLLLFPIKENMLKQKERNYPVDFIYPSEEQFVSFVRYPEQLKLVDYPKHFKMDNELATITIESFFVEGELRIQAKYGFKKATYQASEYERIKSYFDIIVKKFNEPVVFEKSL